MISIETGRLQSAGGFFLRRYRRNIKDKHLHFGLCLFGGPVVQTIKSK
jgi:hypothetical protein